MCARGQLTLPANLRKRFGIKDGGAIILEERDNEPGAAQHFSLFTSDAAIEEAERNLSAKYPDSLPLFAALQGRITPVTADLSAPFPDGLPAKDAVIFQAAVTCRATHLLTGDVHHFWPLMNRPEATCSIIVQTVTELLAAL
jgi:bifunctional DNA-binding transcriptional regulator/antitoxin component of YhaV-PrlF toxin-antitoxin module